MPTNIDFILKLANHGAFEDGDVETHFIEHYKDDLFVNPSQLESVKEAYDAAKYSAFLVAACVCEKEIACWRKRAPGKFRVPFPYQYT